MELSFRRPDIIAALSNDEQVKQVRENDDLCILNGQRFFVRAVLPLAVEAWSISYNIGLWVEVEQRAFERINELWDDPAQSNEPPFAAVLANHLPVHAETIGLGSTLHLTGPATRPEVRLESSAHALYAEQIDGISIHRAHEYSALFA